MISAIAYGAPPERQAIYRERLRDIAGFVERGEVRLPTVTTLGPLSAATVREAHRRLESGHTIGKLVATVRLTLPIARLSAKSYSGAARAAHRCSFAWFCGLSRNNSMSFRC